MSDDFLYHKVSEEEKEKIRKQAKEIMDNFSKKLDKVKAGGSELMIERESFARVEKDGKNSDEDFRKRIFENAPNKNKDFLTAEKKKW